MPRVLPQLDLGQEVTVLGQVVGDRGQLDEVSGRHGYLRAVTARIEHGRTTPIAKVEFFEAELGTQWVRRDRLAPLIESAWQKRARRARLWLRANLSSR